jgi:hypothetical protein
LAFALATTLFAKARKSTKYQKTLIVEAGFVITTVRRQFQSARRRQNMMYRRTLLVVLFVSSMSQLCLADLIATESFDYPLDDLDGQNGGTGFGEEWFVGSAFTFEVIEPNPPMQYNMPGSGVISGGATALRFGNDDDFVLENEAEALSRPLSDVFDGDNLYLSYLYRYDTGFVDDNDFVVWWFNDETGPVIGLKGNGGNGSQPEDLIARVGNFFEPPRQEYAPDVDISEEEGTIGTDFFIVGHLSRGDNSDDPEDYDQFELWVNPSFDEADSPHAEAFGLPEDFLSLELELLGMRAFSQEPGDSMLFDALRIGTTWEDVVSPLGDAGVAGDYNGDGQLTAVDIDTLSAAVRDGKGDAIFDLNSDGSVDDQDRTTWVEDLKSTYFGDSDLDLEFNSSDFVLTFRLGQYEDGVPGNSGWESGDWNGDTEFDSSDFVTAFSAGGFEIGPRPDPAAAVPEPTGITSLLASLLIGWAAVRRRRSF